MKHPARSMSFDELHDGMEAARAAGLVSRREHPVTGRVLYCYTNRCVYENGWDDFSLLARGLIVSLADRTVVATPFPKFFNAGERGRPIPALPFEAFEKLDGSLAIIHWHDGQWRAATKGAFESPQAQWAEERLAAQDLTPLVPGATYLAEAIYPENRIVIRYDEPELVLLAAYSPDGEELSTSELVDVSAALGWRMAGRFFYPTFADLAAQAKTLPATAEGFVLRFADGTRIKVKGDEYRRIHSLISGCTPLAMWEALMAGDDMDAIRRDLPEEFLPDFDAIVGLIGGRVDELLAQIEATAASVAHLSDKELGLSLKEQPEDIRSFLFPYRKNGGKIDGRTREALFRSIRPTRNELPGYVPSYAMNRVMDEAA